ncbi:MAG: ATP-binding protein, partial [Candidatus ainarchaeum sp.]|nr:ATP-binding protein [Candidatus ainarchaeum sp.]
PPGCGKTLIVRAASGELKAAFITVSGAELVKRGYSQAVSVLKEAFLRAKENTPAILFIDEIETMAPSRARGGGDIVGQLLTEMDGMKELKGVVVIGATNKPDILDPAILRPGRFDKIFYIPPPDLEGRKQVFQINLGDFAQGIDLERLAQESEGFSAADIASVAQAAKMEALREKIKGGAPKIGTAQLLKILEARRPSITESMLEEYQGFMNEYGERR